MSSGRGAAVKQKRRVRHSALRSNHSVEEKIMLKKKFFAKALAFAMATGLMATAAPIGAAAPAVVAQAAEIAAPSKVEVDYENFALKVTVTADDKFLQLEVLKDEAGSKVSATYVYTLFSASRSIVLHFVRRCLIYGFCTHYKSGSRHS